MRHMKKSHVEESSYAVHRSWYDLIFQIADEYQLDTTAIIGMEPQQLANLQPDVRQLRKILHQLVEASGDILLPAKAAKNLHALSFGALSLVLWTSPNLFTLMKTCAEYGMFFGTPIRIIFKETAKGDGEFWLIDSEPYNQQAVITHVGLILIIATLVRIILKTTTEPDIEFDIYLAREEIPDTAQQAISKALNCQIHFNAPITKVAVSRRYLFSPLRDSNPEINNLNQKLLRKEAATLASSNIVIQAYKVFDETGNLADMSGEELANKLNLSVRTLNRRLREADINYRGLIDKYKLEKAMHLLHDPDISMTEISYQLGFSDLSTFSRAFKRWTGTSPSQIKF